MSDKFQVISFKLFKTPYGTLLLTIHLPLVTYDRLLGFSGPVPPPFLIKDLLFNLLSLLYIYGILFQVF